MIFVKHILIQKWSAIYPNGDVLGQLVAIVEDDNEVDLEVNLKLRMMKSRTRVDLREQHIQGHLETTDHVAIGHLDVLHLCRIGLILEMLNAD